MRKEKAKTYIKEFDSTIESIQVNPMSGNNNILSNYFDDVMVQEKNPAEIDDVKLGKKEITLNSSMINMGTPQAFCVGLPKPVIEFAANYVSENLFMKELNRYDNISEEDENQVMKIHKLFRAVRVKQYMMDKTLLEIVHQDKPEGLTDILKKKAQSPLESTAVVIISGIDSKYLPQSIKMFKQGVKEYYEENMTGDDD